MSQHEHDYDNVVDLRARRRAKAERAEREGLANRPTRSEARNERTRTDYRLRTGVLRGTGTPPTAEYRKAREALETPTNTTGRDPA